MTVVGQPTPRIDAVERVTGKATYTGDVQLPGMLYARVLRSPHPHARIRSHRRVEGAGAARREGDPHARELHRSSGAPARSPAAQQYNDEVKKITKQRRYAFNNPVRFVGEPVAAVAAVNRHVAEEALQLIVVDYEVAAVRRSIQEDALEAGRAEDLAGGQPVAERAQRGRSRIGAEARQRRARRSRPPTHVFEDRYSTAFVHNAQMEPRVVRRALGRRQADGLHADRRHRELPHTTSRATSACPHEKVRVVCQYMGGNFGNKNQNQDADLIAAVLAKEAGAPVKLELSRKEDFIGVHGRWPTVAVLQGRRRRTTARCRRFSCAATAAWGRTARTPARSAASSSTSAPNIESVVTPGLHEQDGVGKLPRAGVPAGLLRHPVDDGRRRLRS